jgi:hypothetical protein
MHFRLELTNACLGDAFSGSSLAIHGTLYNLDYTVSKYFLHEVNFVLLVKQSCPCAQLIKHYAMKAYVGVDV